MNSWKFYKNKHKFLEPGEASPALQNPEGPLDLKWAMNDKASTTNCISYDQLHVFKPFFENKIVMDVGYGEGHILYFMWFFGAKFVYGCEKGYPGGAFHKSFLTRLRTKPNVTMIRDNFFNLPTEIIQTVEVFWVCIGVGAGNIISHILKHSPSATIFHLAVENNQPELLKARNLGIRTYNI